MSQDINLRISVPRSGITEFYSKYLNLVETFYYVTLTESKSAHVREKCEFVYFNVIFNFNPLEGNFNAEEIVGRIQVKITDIVRIFIYVIKNRPSASRTRARRAT